MTSASARAARAASASRRSSIACRTARSSTETIAVYLWRVGWDFTRVSHAAAMSLILMLVVVLYTVIAIHVLRRERRRLAGEVTR